MGAFLKQGDRNRPVLLSPQEGLRSLAPALQDHTRKLGGACRSLSPAGRLSRLAFSLPSPMLQPLVMFRQAVSMSAQRPDSRGVHSSMLFRTGACRPSSPTLTWLYGRRSETRSGHRARCGPAARAKLRGLGDRCAGIPLVRQAPRLLRPAYRVSLQNEVLAVINNNRRTGEVEGSWQSRTLSIPRTRACSRHSRDLDIAAEIEASGSCQLRNTSRQCMSSPGH